MVPHDHRKFVLCEQELTRAHARLDEAGVPRNDDDGRPLSLALRISVALSDAGEAQHE